MSERPTDAVREQVEAIWQIGNRYAPDAERKQDIAESLATFTEALRARVAKLEAALNEVRPWVDRRQDDHCNAHGGRSPKLDGLLRTIDAALKDAPQ